MSLLDKASLVVTANAYKTSKLYSVVPSDGSGDMTVTRATTATRVNSAGLIEVVPRNIYTYSNDFTNSVWTKLNSSITSNQVGYDGTNNASLLIENSTNNFHLLSNTPTLSGQTTISVYAKANTRNWLYLRGVQSATPVFGWFNLSNGTLGTIQTNGTGSITSIGNGWYRCSLTIANFDTGFETYIGISNADNVNSYLGNGSSIFIQNAQVESFPTATEYFPTTTRLNIPRIDYTNGSCPSLLVEPQRTNLCPTSSNFGVTLFNVTVSRNVVTAPNGNNEADRLLDNNANDEHLLSQNYSSITNGTTYTYSCFFKSDGTGGRAVIRTYVGNWVYAVYNLNNGTVAFTDGSLTASIQNFGNGWYRCILTTTAVMDYDPMVTQIGVANSSNQYIYQGTSNLGLYFHGYQAEQGSYATSYIPTTSTAVTRNADVISKTGISSLIGQTEGTIYAEIKVNKLIGTASRYIFHISDGTANNRIYMAFSGSSSNILRGRIFNSGTLQCSIDSSTITTTGTYKLALAYKNNDIVFYINGVQIGVDTSASIPTCSRVDIGHNYAGASQLGDNIVNANIFKTRLTNSELQSLTTL
jgi:hypothetical protein